MATSDIPQVSKTWNCSSFQTNSFDYQWTITEARTRLSVCTPLESPYFYPDLKVNGYDTQWKMKFKKSKQTQGYSYISLQLYMSYCSNSSFLPKVGDDIGMWAGMKFCLLKPKTVEPGIMDDSFNAPPYSEVHVRYLPSSYYGHNASSSSLTGTVNVKYGTFVGLEQHCTLADVTKALFNNTLTVYCKVDIYMLDQPMHKLTSSSSPMIQEPAFNLSETMEEARKKDLFTDVTLVVGDKEFKAHRAVLASQSPFFKTRFEQHWQREDNRVEMSDLTSDILEAMISFMYTGKVPNTDTLAFQLLPAAEEYGLVGLRLLCERVLSDSLSSQNVIENIILADTHNADGLKSACMSYITKNPSEAQKSEGWRQMKATRGREGLRMEILDAIAESLIK